MATALSLALKISADASAFRLDPVQNALVKLGDQTDKIVAQFDKFAASTPAAAQAQQDFADKTQALTNALRDGLIEPTKFAIEYEKLSEAAKKSADQFQRGAEITDRNRTAAERFDAVLPQLRADLEAGAISEQTFNRETERLAKGMSDSERAARGLGPALGDAAKEGLKFNELSGIFAILPGPIGNVAGRLSGLASAGEGLSRVFSGGLQAGLTSVATSVTALINPFTLAAAGIVGLGTAASAVASGLRTMEAETEKLQNAATKLGVSFDFLQTLQQAAEMSGVSFETVNGAMTKLLRTLAGADEESKQATAALDRLGISLDDLNGKDTEGQIRLIGERLKNIEDPAKRAAAAMAIFGKSGADILPFFDNLGIAEKTLDRFNARLSSLDVTRVLALGDSFDAVTASIRGIGNEVLTPFIGITQSIADGLASSFAAFGKVIGNILDIISPLTSAIGLVANVVLQLASVFANAVGTALEPFAAAGRAISLVFDAISRAATEVFGYINDIINGFGKFFAFNGAIESMNAAFSALWETLGRIANIITTAFSKAGEYVGGFVKSFLDFTGLTPAIEYIGNVISTVFGSVSSVFSTIANAIGGVVGRLLTMAEKFLGIERPAQAASDATSGAAENVANLSKEQQKAMEAVNKELEKSQQSLNSGIEAAGKYGQEGFNAALRYQQALREVDELMQEGEYTAEQHARAVANVTQEFNKELEVVKKNADERKRLADESERLIAEEIKRVDALLSKQTAVDQLSQDVTATQNEIARTEAALAEARVKNNEEEINRLTQRLARLDQLQASLADQSDQAAQGFAEGFDKAFANVDKGLGTLIDKSAEFGQAGFEAAQQLTDGIEKAKAAVKDGILNKEAFDREVERQKKLYEDRVKGLQEAAKITEQLYKKESELLTKQFEIDRERAVELAAIRTGAIKIQDIRTGGITAFFDTLKEDPAIGEAKKQTKELQKIREEIAKLQSERVDILAGTG